MKLVVLLSLFMFLIFSGCSNKQEKLILKNEYPMWYLNPITRDEVYLYGIGEGETLDEAVKDALSSISENLSVSISSNSTLKKESVFKFREYVFKEYKQDINTRAENLIYRNFETINFHKYKYNQFLAQVKVRKIDVINYLKNEFNLLNNMYQNTITLKNDDLSLYLKLKDVKKAYLQNINKIEILRNLDDSFNENLFYNSLNNIFKKSDELKEKINFSIYLDKSNEILIAKMKDYISNNNFRVKNNANYLVNVITQFNFKSPNGIYISNTSVLIEIIHKEKIIISKQYLVDGYSSNSIDDAIFDSYEKLDLDLF